MYVDYGREASVVSRLSPNTGHGILRSVVAFYRPGL